MMGNKTCDTQFEHHSETFINGTFTKVLKSLLASLKRELQNNEFILFISCGLSQYTFLYRGNHYHKIVTAKLSPLKQLV